MFVIEVIPLGRNTRIESLSYYTSEPYEPGTIVSMPIRRKTVSGVVIEVKEVSSAKTALRAATFSLKKLPAQKAPSRLSRAFIQTARELSDYYACSIGAMLHALLPPSIRDGTTELVSTRTEIPAPEVHTPEILQDTPEERFLVYRSLVRETLAHSESILLVVPSSIEAEMITTELASGIEERVVTLTSTMGKKALQNAYQKLNDFSKAKLVITTPTHALVQRHDISTIIIESERSQNYRARKRPYLDYRTALLVLAKHTGRRLIFSDLLVRTEEEALRRDEIYREFSETPGRLSLSGKLTVVPLKSKTDGESFTLFAPKVLQEIERAHKAKGRVFIFAPRRGLAPVVACVDCGHIFRCPETGAPYSLIRTKKDGVEKRWFVCSVSGRRVPAADVCPNCGSWRLRERGIGIQHVHDELAEILPNIPLIQFDHLSASTFKKAHFLRKKFYETKGSVMLGTPMALPYLTDNITMSVIVNTDALRATPTWHQQEETLATLLHLRDRTADTLFVQTRSEPDDLLEYAKNGALAKFYDEEIELRTEFKYPPHAHLIHLTWQGSEAALQEVENTIQEPLTPWKPLYYSAPTNTPSSGTRYALMRLPSSSWPDQKLVATLRGLPPSIRVMMNPDRII